MTEALFTQFAALLAAALLIPSFVFLAYGVNHRNMPFWWTAAIAYFLIFFGSTLAAARNILPELLVAFLANALIAVGYILCLRAVRFVKSVWRFSLVEMILLAAYMLALVLIVGALNTYTARVTLISAFITVISLAALVTVISSSVRISRLGDAALMVFAAGNAVFAAMRGLTAQLGRDVHILRFELWDQVFFVWSIAAVFCFAIGLFLNGTALIGEETRRAFEKERRLTDALTEALEGQRNLQKLILHELKRPLNAMMTAVELSRQAQTGMSSEEVERVHQLTRLANDYLRGIGEYEDIHALFQSPTPTEVRVSRLLDDIRNKWQIAVHPSDEAAGATLAVDLLLFDIAIGNLIDNALKFGNSARSVRMTVSKTPTELWFDVIDDGPGIPPSEAEKVFRQFYKINSHETNAISGCGLGLYVVRRIAEAHGGESRVVSRRPSTLRLTFPLKSHAVQADD